MAKIIFIIIIISVLNCACEEEKPNPLAVPCYLKPDPGPCEAAIPRYYFDQSEKKCKEFIWGGCEGVVPFKTMADCKKECGG
ncbi:MAG: BPTI/Kunitz domain-containing protein [Candidatus Marinimicrobia bacterium]|jgi:hypothetical protein|nr:BPTI/Kunitz domain-containing protein [Candidatus Neomarinimicrobiota bacterium]MDP6611195.1 BPTI/Kunitz domain-containing protein [Candidatus Neomarinimicrobiota bacterium]|tara:strand:- start:5588 stop:5833 length:246 start_codon:yes stop_codon:yes gene_type:complete